MKIKHYQPLTYITYSIVGITVLTGILLSCNIPIFPGISVNGSTLATTQTKTTSTNAAIRVRSTCSMTATIEPGEEHAANMINGQYKENIGKTTIATFCNDPNGYAIYAIGYTGGDAGVAAGTNTVLHSDALGSTYDIITGTSTNGSDNNDTSNWAMKLTALGTIDTYKPDILNGYNNFSLVPQNYTKVASYNTATDLDNPASTRLGSNLTTTYAAYISNTQPAGTYEGQVKYVLVNPSTMDSPYYMQTVDEWGDTIAVGREVIAYDTRDNKSYTVRRMCMEGTGSTWQEKEASCTKENSMLWMTQNLDLDLTRDTLLTSEDTDLNESGSGAYNADYAVDVLGNITWNPATATITDVNTSDGSFNNWGNSTDVAYSADPDAGNPNNPWYATGEAYSSNLCLVGYNFQTCDYLKNGNETALNYFSNTTSFDSNGNHGKIGNYYNWSAAIASSNSSSISQNAWYDATKIPKNSICPRGWRLPTIGGDSKAEFYNLNYIYNDASTTSIQGLVGAPVYMIRPGRIKHSSISGLLELSGYYGDYWSAAPAGTSNAFSMLLGSGEILYYYSGLNRSAGASIRCVSDY